MPLAMKSAASPSDATRRTRLKGSVESQSFEGRGIECLTRALSVSVGECHVEARWTNAKSCAMPTTIIATKNSGATVIVSTPSVSVAECHVPTAFDPRATRRFQSGFLDS